MPSLTEACNLALSHLGVSKEIQAVETEQSKEAAACRRFAETARKATLRDADWPFATARADLQLIQENPNDDWDYEYGYPNGCLKARRIPSGTYPETRASRIPFKIAYTSTKEVIHTNLADAALEYTIDIEDPGRWPPDFLIAYSYRLAVYLAPRLTAGDPFKTGANAMRMYQFEISKATATAFNEEQPSEDPDPEMIRARS